MTISAPTSASDTLTQMSDYEHVTILNVTCANRTNAARVEGWSTRYTQLSRGGFACQLSEIRIPGLQIFVENCNSIINEYGTAASGTFVFSVPLAWFGEGSFNGKRWTRGINVFRGDREIEVLLPPMSILVVAIDRRIFNDYMMTCEGVSTETWLTKNWLLFEDDARCRDITCALVDVFQACINNPLSLDSEANQRDILHNVLQILAPLASPDEAVNHPCYGEFSRTQTIKRARAFMLENMSEPLQVIDICRAAGVSRRTLQYTFQETLNVNPAMYLRLLRLNGVRRDLLAAAHEPVMVKDVVARWGFWHLSRFSAQYHEMFDELPSTTLERAKHARRLHS